MNELDSITFAGKLFHSLIVLKKKLCLYEYNIKTHSSELQGQHARTSSGPRDHYGELFTQMAALKFKSAVTITL